MGVKDYRRYVGGRCLGLGIPTASVSLVEVSRVSVPVTAACARVVARHVFVVCECVLPWTAIEANCYVFSRTVCNVSKAHTVGICVEKVGTSTKNEGMQVA